jgi:catechol 2,3-dioxygenase-like lactoylglutathione lyase family enzyme
VSFCHLVVGVTDMDRALAFYRDVIGMEVVFETLISGEPFDAVPDVTREQEGRVVGGLLSGLMVELLSRGTQPPGQEARASRHHRNPQRVTLRRRSRRHSPSRRSVARIEARRKAEAVMRQSWSARTSTTNQPTALAT